MVCNKVVVQLNLVKIATLESRLSSLFTDRHEQWLRSPVKRESFPGNPHYTPHAE